MCYVNFREELHLEKGRAVYCEENDIDFFAYMTLEQGALSGKYGTSNPMPEGSQRAMTTIRFSRSSMS
ncbi:MAG: hypothetical protein K2N25_09205 [Muribaculaceae bacterium]|nr:hypothetical protein [Muribaculaceae bacterium]